MVQTKNNIKCEISPYLPDRVRECVMSKDERFWDKLREIRITADMPVLADTFGGLSFLKNSFGKKLVADKKCMEQIVEGVTQGSMYSVNETIKNGFVTIPGGHRIGFCGSAVSDRNGVRHIKDISSVCIRISREILGCAKSISDEIFENGKVCNVLIASPPGCGKTTVLRDICRMLANGELSGSIIKVGIADERGEIAAMCSSRAQHSIGCGAFVCDGYKKSDAMNMMLRSMSPDVLVTDEIGDDEDFSAVKKSLQSGVSVIASAHAYSVNDLYERYGKEVINTCFEKIIFLKDKGAADKIYRRNDCDN